MRNEIDVGRKEGKKNGQVQLSMDINAMNKTSSHGMVRPISCSNPNSSSARLSKSWNFGWSRYEIGMTCLRLLCPTYTAKWPLGTSVWFSCCLLPMLEHLLRICFNAVVLEIAMVICSGDRWLLWVKWQMMVIPVMSIYGEGREEDK